MKIFVAPISLVEAAARLVMPKASSSFKVKKSRRAGGAYADLFHKKTGALLADVLVAHIPYMVWELEQTPVDWSSATAADIRAQKDTVLPILLFYGRLQHSDVLANGADRERVMRQVKARVK